MSPFEVPADLLAAIEREVTNRSGTKKGDEIRFRCPMPDHEDPDPDASWNTAKHVWHCYACGAGGGALDLAKRLGIDLPGGDADTSSRKRPAHSYTPNLTVSELAEAKGIDEAQLRSWGVSDVKYQGGPAVRIVYHDPDGSEGAVRYRKHLEKQEHDDRFAWKSGSKVVRLYGLNRRTVAQAAGYTWLVEGESDSWTAWQAGEPALGVPGASNWKDERDAQHVAGADRIYAVVEPDQGGETFRKKLIASSISDLVYLVDLSPWGVKDLSALYLADRDQFKDHLEEAKANAVAVADLQAAEDEAATRAAYESAYDLLYESNILTLVRNAMRRRGYAGSLDAPVMAYVCITSAHLESPLNMAFIAPSGAGKNRAVDEGRAFAPEDMVHEIKAGSARAVIYDDAPLDHRVVLFSEADSIPEDGPAASAVRNIASDNVMQYEVVERDESTGKWGVRKIKKPGPTSLITTSTRSLRHQFDTRVLEVPIPDDAGQTRAVMRAHAASLMPGTVPAVDLAPFIAVQQWIRLAGERRIAVPFAEALSELLPAGAVRMRRDFRQLLTFVQAIALLHQCTRERTPEGWIVASIGDYSEARTLLAPIFDVSTSEGVTPAIREVVNAIGEKEEVSLADLAKRLKLAKTTVNWRTQRAIRGGWIVNNEARKGQPARFARGTPLPEDVSALPTLEALLAAYECTSDFREDRADIPPPIIPIQRPRTELAATGTDGWRDL